MRRLSGLLLCAVLLFNGMALAEAGDGSMGDMVVVNCQNWVSLRAEPSASAERLDTIPLGALVSDCRQYDQNFAWCTYDGQTGYVLLEYLAPAAGPDFQIAGYSFYKERAYESNGERLTVRCVDADGAEVWRRETATSYSTELDLTEAFAAGTADLPLVMIYNAETGLFAVEPETGESLWVLDADEVDLGGCISYAVKDDGTMYIGGYYGPDPVAISMAGEVLWSSYSDEATSWLYAIEILPEGIRATYDSMEEGGAGTILFGWDGAEISRELLS